MNELTKNDFKFLLHQTKLPPKQLNILLEEETDIDLILDSICSKKFTRKTLQTLSFTLLTKLIVFKVSKDKNYDIEEKSYIANAIINYLPLIADHQEVKTKNKSDEFSKYYLVLFGFLENITDQDIFKKIEANFRLAGKREMAQHLKDWIALIREVKFEFFHTVKK